MHGHTYTRWHTPGDVVAGNTWERGEIRRPMDTQAGTHMLTWAPQDQSTHAQVPGTLQLVRDLRADTSIPFPHTQTGTR
jgi:hypothetical protein